MTYNRLINQTINLFNNILIFVVSTPQLKTSYIVPGMVTPGFQYFLALDTILIAHVYLFFGLKVG